MMGKAWKGHDWGKFIENTWTWRLSAIEPLFLWVWGLYIGMEAPRKAPQGYSTVCVKVGYAKRLREELFI